MLNKEKYAKEIVELATNGNGCIAIVNDRPCCCEGTTSCPRCDLACGDCDELLKKWTNSEYQEREIDWSKVPVDTPIVVWDNDYRGYYQRHFACFKNDIIYAWDDGRTSYTANNEMSYWKNAQIAEGIDCSEWYK